LLDIPILGSDWLKKINALELKYPSVSWLLSSLAINDLALHLNGNLKMFYQIMKLVCCDIMIRSAYLLT
jgi:hypothetical protein